MFCAYNGLVQTVESFYISMTQYTDLADSLGHLHKQVVCEIKLDVSDQLKAI